MLDILCGIDQKDYGMSQQGSIMTSIRNNILCYFVKQQN